MTTSPDLLALINPLSGTLSLAQKEALRTYLLAQARALGFRPEALFTTHAGHATELAQTALRQGIRRILAVGGDGTINETARSLRHSNTALGIVPLGSGNGLARHLGVPLDPRKAIDKALNGRPVVIDSGEIAGHPFFCTAGFGFEAYIAHEFAQQPTRGLTTYAQTAYRLFWSYKPKRYVVNGEEKSLFSLTFANAAQFGNNAWIAPRANIADGELEQCEVIPFPRPAGVRLVWQLFNRTLDQSAYWHGTAVRSATVQGEAPLLLHADGEPIRLATDTCRVTVLPGSLLVLL